MKKLKIMWLHSHLTNWGGGTKFVFEVIKELSKKHQITLFIQKSHPEISERFNEIPITVITLSQSSTGDIVFWLNFTRQINKEIRYLQNEAKKYDLVISSMFPMNIVGNAINIPHMQYCFEPFAFFWDSLMIERLPLMKRLFLHFLKYRFGRLDIQATRKSMKILTVNCGTKEWVSNIYGRDSIITLLGVDTSFFKDTSDTNLQEKYRDKKIIIHSTDWTPIKRTNWLIDEFVYINSIVDNVMLLITETQVKERERDIAIRKIKKEKLKNIELCGFIPHTLLPSYYSLAEVAVYPGIGEGASAASLFVLECMSCETPVVRTNYTNEEVEHGKTGFMFKKDDKENFHKYVIELLTNKELNSHFGKAGRTFIEEKYSWKKVAEIFENNCLEILN